MEWIAPIAALAGVVVGGVLNAALAAEFDRRRELAAGAVAGRFVRDELELIGETVEQSLKGRSVGGDTRSGAPARTRAVGS